MVEAAIEINNVKYKYPGAGYNALTDINLTVERGTFVAIVGKTGSGKSTLTSLIDGLILPTAGSLVVRGVEITPNTKQARLSEVHHHVGYVFQFPEQQLFAETVAKDIAFGPQNLGWNDVKISKAVENALEKVGLPLSLKKQSPFTLSGGQMRRVAIAGVLATQPEILILDEPTAGLDNRATFELLEFVSKLNKSGTTIIMVTHQMEQVAKYADKVVVMDNGKVAVDASPKALFAEEKQLKSLSLALPLPVDFARKLNNEGIKLNDLAPLTLEELADEIAIALRSKE